MVSRTRFACLLPILIFIALRALSYANPTPLPWTSGVFDAQGLDDVLQTIRIAYTKAADLRVVPHELLAMVTGGVTVSEPALTRGAFLTTAHSRAPPSS